MSDFSNFVEKGNESIRNEADKAKVIIAEKKNLFELKKELTDRYTELEQLYGRYGKSCFEGHPDKRAENSIEIILDAILDLESAIREAEYDEEAFVYCRKCKKNYDLNDVFCLKCGGKLKK